MGDYALAGLSPRSFEHLVQALALRVIGDRVTVFGDGPDGGREATFDGETNYGTGGATWAGYGVIQAKFRAKSEGTSSDGEWFLTQLKKELGKLRRRNDVRQPEYYIVATNVTLSPAASAGAKDRVAAELVAFSDESGLVDFDVWDYDKLRILLDNNDNVRRAYAAFITSGDVLSELQDWLHEQRADFRDILITFLQKEVTSDQFAKLEQAGYSADDQIPLSNVFVDLPVAAEPHLEPPDADEHGEATMGFTRYLLDVGRDRFVTPPTEEGIFRFSEPVGEEVSGRFVLLGGPGQGKTTVGQYLCQLYRCAILQDVSASHLSYEARQAIDQITNHCADEGLDLPQVRRFPLRVVLSEFASQLASDKANSLLAFVTNLFNKRTDAGVVPSQVKRFLSGYPCLIILDGLDEVPASSNRSEVLAAIRDFWVDLSAQNIDAVVVATSRPQGYNDDFSSKTYRHLYMVPLRPDQALRYGERLTEIRFGNDPDRASKVFDRLTRASNEESTARLMRSPLQVTIMTLLVDRMGRPPQERWHLFNEYYKLIYQREIERDIPAAEVLRDHRVDIDKIHRRVALLLQSESERSGRTDARLSSDQFAYVVEQRLREEGFESDELEQARLRIIEGAATRLVFLVGVEEGLVGFEVRSLQEFMAAEGLMDGDDNITQCRLQAIASNTNWRNVFLFAAGKCFSERQYLRDTVVSLCGGLNEDAQDDILVATLSGSQLALEIMEDGSLRGQPAYLRQVTRIALRLLTLPPTNLHRRLAEVYQPNLRPLYVEALDQTLAMSDTEERLGAVACAVVLSELFPDDFDPLVQRKLGSGALRTEGVFQTAASFGFRSDVVLRLLVESFPKQPVAAAGSAFPSNARGPILRAASSRHVPRWLASTLSEVWRLEPPYQNLVASISEPPYSGVISFNLHSIREEPSRTLIDLVKMPAGTDEWERLRLSFQFALDPGKETLAAALAARARGETSDAYFRRLFPWPLDACIRFATSRDIAKQLAEMADRGELGDVDTWARAEQRWRSVGLTTHDLRAGFPKLGTSNDIAAVGFPFAAAGLEILYETGGSEIYEFLDAQLDPVATRLMARRMAVAIDQQTDAPPEDEVLERLITVLVRSDDLYWSFLILPFMREPRLSEPAIQAMDERALNRPTHFRHVPVPPLQSLVLHSYNNHPDSPGLLMLVAQLAMASGEFVAPIREYRGPALPQTMAASASIQLRLGKCPSSEEIKRIVDDYPEAVFDFLSVISNRPNEEQERLLWHLFRAVPASRWSARAELMSALREAAAKRRSALTNPATWPKLGLSPEPSAIGFG